MNKHLMLDLETLSTAPNALIISIGAVVFDLDSLDFIYPDNKTSTFYHVIDYTTESKAFTNQFDISLSTLVFWTENAANYPKAFPGHTLNHVLYQFKDFHRFHAVDLPNKQLPVWCNGASFDFPILDHAFSVIGLGNPIGYHQQHDYRTLANLYLDIKQLANTQKHNALADAVSQTKHLFSILRHIRNIHE